MDPIDWRDVALKASFEGCLLPVLLALSRERWMECVTNSGSTLLHLASHGRNVDAVVALLRTGSLDANVVCGMDRNAAHVAAFTGQAHVLEALCAAGTNLRACDYRHHTPLDRALATLPYDKRVVESVRVLVANGVRLSTAGRANRCFVTPELEAFERGVLRCRAAVVAMLRVKRASGRLAHWDKYLLRYLAVAVWSTRYAKEWQLN